MLSNNQKIHRKLQWLALATIASSPALALAQLPPPDLVLSDPRAALFEFGPVDFHLRASTSFVYDDNIDLHDSSTSGGIDANGKSLVSDDDFIFTFAPTFIFSQPPTLDANRTTWSVDYTPSFIYFLKNDEENSVDQNVRAQAGYALTKLTLGLSASYVKTAGGVIDVGSRVSQNNYSTALTARYEMTEKTFFQMDGSFILTDYETLTDSAEWKVTPTMNYQVSPKVTLGLGLTLGQLYVGQQSSLPGTNQTIIVTREAQTYIGPTLRASYRTTEKTDVSLSVGTEWRTYPSGDTTVKPIFALSGTYRPFDGTALSIEGHQHIENSAVISGANYITTGASLSVRQRLIDRLSGTFSFTYDHSDYAPVSAGVTTTRVDDYFLLRTGLDATLGRSWTVGVFYLYREDVSTDSNYSFQNNQVGLQATWAY